MHDCKPLITDSNTVNVTALDCQVISFSIEHVEPLLFLLAWIQTSVG